MDNYSNNNSYDNYSNDNKNNYSTSLYTESYKKPKKKKPSILTQMIIVGLVCSILGGTIVFTAFQFVAPAIQPSINKYVDNIIPKNDNTDNVSGNPQNTGNQVNSVTGKSLIDKISSSSGSVVTEIAEKVSPAIVGIRVTAKTTDIFFGEREGKGEGSGIIVKDDGYVITNYHVIQQALDRNGKLTSTAKIEVFLPHQKDKPYKAQVIGTDFRTDLAVLKIEGNNFPVAELGNSDDIKIGELAVAIGNPGGLEYMGSVTVGVISGINRTIVSESGDMFKLIQTDAAINPGNSGGALLNSKGQVIGVNSIKIVAQGFEGLGFAIPINTVKEITNDLMEYKYVKGRPFFGISSDPNYDEEAAKYYGRPVGILVQQVIPFTGAYKAGIQVGDIITKFDGKPVKTVKEMNEIKNKYKPGDAIPVELYREGETFTVKVTLTEEK